MSYTTKLDRIINVEYGTFKFSDASTLEIDLSNGKVSIVERCRKITATDFKTNKFTKISCPTNTYATASYLAINNEIMTEREFLSLCFDINKQFNNRG